MPKKNYLSNTEIMNKWLRWIESNQKWFEDRNSYMCSPLDIDYKNYNQIIDYDKRDSRKTFSDISIRINTLHKHAHLVWDENPTIEGYHAEIKSKKPQYYWAFNPDLKFKPRKITNPWNETIIADSPNIIDGKFRVGFESEKKNNTKKAKPLTKTQRKQITNYY